MVSQSQPGTFLVYLNANQPSFLIATIIKFLYVNIKINLLQNQFDKKRYYKNYNDLKFNQRILLLLLLIKYVIEQLLRLITLLVFIGNKK